MQRDMNATGKCGHCDSLAEKVVSLENTIKEIKTVVSELTKRICDLEQFQTNENPIPGEHKRGNDESTTSIASGITLIDLPCSTTSLTKSTANNSKNTVSCTSTAVIHPQPQLRIQIKWITTNQTGKIGILTQNVNGICPLIAVMNCLLLGKKTLIPENCQSISMEEVLQGLITFIVDSKPTNIPQSKKELYEYNLQEAIDLLPKLQTGLDVNVRFTGISNFEYTKDLVIFDLLGIPLYHGWLYDPSNNEIANVIGSLSYNQLSEKIMRDEVGEDPRLKLESLVGKTFLNNSATQLTPNGLYELKANIPDATVSVLFRNDHFATLLKLNDELYTLVTAEGLLDCDKVVWETLSCSKEGPKLVDGNFAISRGQ